MTALRLLKYKMATVRVIAVPFRVLSYSITLQGANESPKLLLKLALSVNLGIEVPEELLVPLGVKTIWGQAH